MQTSGGSSGGGSSAGGSGEPSRSGLARFRSAPASWLEALLEEEEDDVDPLKQNQSLTQLLSGNSSAPTTKNSVGFVDPGLFDVGTSSSGFARQNSSPAEFLGGDGYFSNFGIGANFDYMAPNVEVASMSAGKRSREGETIQQSQVKYPSQLKVEQSGHLPGGVSGMLDTDLDKLLEDSVPFRVRAKRGCATHPRSIAERVRRTRISDRIRKLQELVPNMDKQTNTADMLEEAVEYVKYLQRQIQELTEQQKNCKCTVRD